MGSHMPTLRVYDNKFTFTREQNSYFFERDGKVELISEGTLRQETIDSLVAIMQTLGDTTIFKFNPCTMSGAITCLWMSYAGDTAKFDLRNTADSTELKIKDILNPYLPKEDQFYGSTELIERELSCKDWLYKSKKERRKELRKERRNKLTKPPSPSTPPTHHPHPPASPSTNQSHNPPSHS